MEKVKAAIIGPGNIGSDLMYKIMRSDCLEMSYMVGIVESEGIRRARKLGFETTTEGVEAILDKDEIKIVFDATGAKAHALHAPLLRKAGKIAIDMTLPRNVRQGPYPAAERGRSHEEKTQVWILSGGSSDGSRGIFYGAAALLDGGIFF